MKEREELLDVREFSQRAKVREATTRKYLLRRLIRSYRLGRGRRKLVRIPASELDRLLTEIPAREVK